MNTFLVGGAVRDELLHIPITERDWVVVGTTAEAMVADGFQPVGKDFPVFLHPTTKEEYALARTERKISTGYTGFCFHASPEITLEQDLLRRDLTINAMAKDTQGHIIDPYGGQRDLSHKTLRHVSPAFTEDPVRILRLARFASRFPEFSVHPETMELMRHMVRNGEVNALVPERVWQEFYRALANPAPERFFECLHQCGAWSILFPMIDIATILIPRKIFCPVDFNVAQRFAVAMHAVEIDQFKKLNAHYRIPKTCIELALLVIQHGRAFIGIALKKKAGETTFPTEMLTLLLKTDALRRTARFMDGMAVVAWCYPSFTLDDRALCVKALKTIHDIDTSTLQQKQIDGAAFANALYALRIAALENI